MTETWPAIELPLPAKRVEEILTALVLRDLLHGASFDVEVEETGREFEVDLMVTDEIDEEEGVYLALVEVEYGGDVDEESLGSFLTQIIDETLVEAERIVEEGKEIGVFDRSDFVFKVVGEDAERWDLVVPDWLAPEDAKTPFGYRSFLRETDEAFPSDTQLDSSGRIIVVPLEGKLHFFACPVPDLESAEEDEEVTKTPQD